MTTHPLTCEQFDAMLPDYLDDSLDAGGRAAVESHAASCLRCAPVLADLSALTRQARALPDLTPSRDLWPNIAGRLQTPIVDFPARAAAAAAAPAAQRPTRSRFLRPAWLAAAAAMLVAATASLTVLATHARSPATSARPSTTIAGSRAAPPASPMPNAAPLTAAESVAAVAAPAPAAPAAPAPRALNASAHRPAAMPVARVYEREIAQLDAIVHDRRSQLDSTTIAVVEKNLRIIDQAIAQSRAALAHDPNSRFLHNQLNDALDQKVSLLRTAALLPART